MCPGNSEQMGTWLTLHNINKVAWLTLPCNLYYKLNYVMRDDLDLVMVSLIRINQLTSTALRQVLFSKEFMSKDELFLFKLTPLIKLTLKLSQSMWPEHAFCDLEDIKTILETWIS